MRLELWRCWTDWYSLRGGSNWASIEGTRAEWIAVANALRHPGVNARFKRLACAWHADREAWAMSSPRNAVGPNDTVWVSRSDGAALAAQIGEELARPDEVET